MKRLLLVVTVLAAIFVGAAAFTFGYAEGASYMTNDPEACANCHVMEDYLTAWTQSSHRNVAVCNDCHAPHDLVGKYVTKAINGWNHSVAFTTGDFPETLQITEMNRGVAEEACRYCHAPMVSQIDGSSDGSHSEARDCATCHTDVGHRDGPPIVREPASTVHTSPTSASHD